jgi:hypothetical protein
MISKLLGIDYDTYCCGGIGNVKLVHTGENTIFFYTESEMLKTLADLKKDHTVGNILVFVTPINRMDYKI